MITKSIRWRLQIWYGLILLVVVVGFGLTAYELERGRQVRRIDEELQRRFGAVANLMRPLPQRPRGPDGFGPGGRPRDREAFPNEREPDPAMRDGPSLDPPPGRFPPRPGEFHLPPVPAALFDEGDTNGYYYVIWRGDGQEMARSANAPVGIPVPLKKSESGPQGARMNGHFREAFHATPRGDLILAGRSMAREMEDLRRTAASLAGIGAGIMLLGLAGGWWSATRAIHPIAEISAAAVEIAAGDLTRRISAADTDNELGRLATVLNSTFARLEGAFAEQKQFTSDAAHELRTPVAVMLTQTQTALTRERTGAEYRESLEACQRAAQRMRRLVESLLELARLDAGQEGMKREPFDLSRAVQDCVELIRPLAEQHRVSIHCDLPAVPCTGDAERIGQVATNLISNAIYYNVPEGEVRIMTRTEGGQAVLTVSNTGPGISADHLPQIFKRFFRGDESRVTGRTGLGLAISKAIVEAHGGTMVASSNMGEGATFTVRLPNHGV